MPKPGWKTLTVKEDSYDHLQKIYDSNKAALQTLGIMSFSGFMVELVDYLTEGNNLGPILKEISNKRFDQIKKMRGHGTKSK